MHAFVYNLLKCFHDKVFFSYIEKHFDTKMIELYILRRVCTPVILFIFLFLTYYYDTICLKQNIKKQYNYVFNIMDNRWINKYYVTRKYGGHSRISDND